MCIRDRSQVVHGSLARSRLVVRVQQVRAHAERLDDRVGVIADVERIREVAARAAQQAGRQAIAGSAVRAARASSRSVVVLRDRAAPRGPAPRRGRAPPRGSALAKRGASRRGA